MKFLQIGLLFLAIFMIFPTVSVCEVVQLVDESHKVKTDKITNHTADELAEIQLIRSLIITFVQSSTDEQSELVTAKFRETFKKTTEILSRTFDKESYPKIDFRKIHYFREGKATAETELYWTTEGYDGVQTFHFMLAKESGKWLVDWMMH